MRSCESMKAALTVGMESRQLNSFPCPAREQFGSPTISLSWWAVQIPIRPCRSKTSRTSCMPSLSEITCAGLGLGMGLGLGLGLGLGFE